MQWAINGDYCQTLLLITPKSHVSLPIRHICQNEWKKTYRSATSWQSFQINKDRFSKHRYHIGHGERIYQKPDDVQKKVWPMRVAFFSVSYLAIHPQGRASKGETDIRVSGSIWLINAVNYLTAISCRVFDRGSGHFLRIYLIKEERQRYHFASETQTSSSSFRAKTQRFAKAGWLHTTLRPKHSFVGARICIRPNSW